MHDTVAQNFYILDAVIAINFVTLVSLSFRMEHLISHWPEFQEI
jgi:hypothetical protein